MIEWIASLSISDFMAGGALIVSLLSIIFTLRTNRNSTYLNTVTAERSKWIEKLRVNIASCSGYVHDLHFKTSINEEFVANKEYFNIVKELNQLISLIKLQLNPKGEIDCNIIALLEQISDLIGIPENDSLIKADDLLILHSQKLLKAEWEKVKSEARWQISYFKKRNENSLLDKYREWAKKYPISANENTK